MSTIMVALSILAFLLGAGVALAARGHLDRKLPRLFRSKNWELDLLAAAVRDALVLMDEQGRVIFWNDGAESMFGYGRATVLGRELHRVLPPERLREAGAAAVARSELWRTGDGKLPRRTVESVARRQDGSELPVEITVSSALVGGRRYASGIIRDMSSHKEREEELRQAKERAEEIATELENVNVMLEKTAVWAKEMAAQATMANAAKSEFLANMSHEIRTPMNGVLGMLTLLEQTRLDAEQSDYIQAIRYSGETLLDIINQILDFSRIESGKVDLEEIEFDLRHEVEQAVVLFGERAEAKGIELLTIISSRLARRVRGDPGRFRQILINLIGNAIKFTKTGEVTLELRPGALEGPDPGLRVEVRDTGIGMSPDVVCNLFQPFYQGDGSTRRKFGGTGLGLAISKKLIEAMQGDIEVSSELGKGTSFHFTIPMGAVPAAACWQDADAPLLAGLGALVVHSNPEVRKMLVGYLQGWGMTVGETGDPAAAIGAFEAGSPPDGLPPDGLPPDCRFVIADSSAGGDWPRLEQSPGHRDAASPPPPPPALVLLVPPKERRAPEALGARALVTKPIRASKLRETLLGVVRPAEPGPAPLAPLVDALSASAAAAGSSSANANASVLVAEDNAVNQKLVRALLQKLGYAVDLVENGRLALSAVAAGAPYSVILMDCEMPVMDGYKATERIRRLKGAPSQIPIVALTASALKGDRERCLDAGMSDYVTKPIRLDALRGALERWCGKVHNPAAAATAEHDAPLLS